MDILAGTASSTSTTFQGTVLDRRECYDRRAPHRSAHRTTSTRPRVNTSVDERSYAGHINICQAVGACGVLDNDLNFTTGGRIDLILSINDDLSVASPSIANGVETSTPHGRIILNSDGSFLYTPASGFIGTDHFGYTVFPESQIGPHEAEVPEHPDGSIKYAIVTIDVYDPPPPTVAKGVDDDLLATEDTTLHIDPATLTANDTSVTWITEVNDNNASIQQPFHTPHGSVTVSFHEAIPGTAFKNVAAIVYTPNLNFTGVDTFTYSVSKGDFLTTNFKARVYLFVGSAAQLPDAANDEATTFENVPITLDVSENDSDLDGDIDPASVIEDLDPCLHQGAIPGATRRRGPHSSMATGSSTRTAP